LWYPVFAAHLMQVETMMAKGNPIPKDGDLACPVQQHVQ